MKLAQGTRAGFLKTPLGDDKLVISSLQGSEGISELFEFHIEALSDGHNLDFDSAIGTNCCAELNAVYPGVKRSFNGILAEAAWTGKNADDLSTYRLTLRPWLWMLSHTTKCRIFEDKSALDVVMEVLGEHSFAKVEKRTTRSYPTLEYCVQYCESDLSFVCRLLEEYGISYFFVHSSDEHKMVLADSASCYKPKPGGAALSYYDSDLKGTRTEDTLNSWSGVRRFRAGRVKLVDYDYENPKADMDAESSASSKYANGQLELYHYPGRFKEKSVGVDLAKVRLEAEQAQDRRSSGSGDAVTCCPGHTAKIQKHKVSGVDGEYLITRASHNFKSNAYRSDSAFGDESYFGYYEYLPVDVPYRAMAVTAKPVIYGPQTAVVVSKVDDQCRLQVKFFWDKKKVSRWVRIGHPWASKEWGNIKIPREDMEVIIEHLEGDPDFPMIVGTVYNGDNKAPYPLPEKQSISGVKSQSMSGSGYNEFIFDDDTGNELVRLHAQHDMEAKIENDERRDIGKTLKVEVGEKIEFIVGGSSKITMTPDTITLSAINIKVNADATLSLTSQGTGELKTNAILTIQGAMVKIN